MKYLLTFRSTTATLQADKIMSECKTKFNAEFSVESIPFSLTKNCYGLGLAINCTLATLKEIKKKLEEYEVDVKHYWEDVNDDEIFVSIDEALNNDKSD